MRCAVACESVRAKRLLKHVCDVRAHLTCDNQIFKVDTNAIYLPIFTKTRQCLKDEEFERALLLEINKKLSEKTN